MKMSISKIRYGAGKIRNRNHPGFEKKKRGLNVLKLSKSYILSRIGVLSYIQNASYNIEITDFNSIYIVEM